MRSMQSQIITANRSTGKAGIQHFGTVTSMELAHHGNCLLRVVQCRRDVSPPPDSIAAINSIHVRQTEPNGARSARETKAETAAFDRTWRGAIVVAGKFDHDVILVFFWNTHILPDLPSVGLEADVALVKFVRSEELILTLLELVQSVGRYSK